jgi:RNA polymerase sigma-70 factor (ECF subfamily)
VTNALQEVWLHALRGIHGLKSGARLAPWLYTIARRTAMTHFRQEYASREESCPEVIDGEIDDVPDEQLYLENAELVHFGLGQLGVAEREVLTLFFLEDLTIAEIGELMSIPDGTVKSRLFKARRDLRRVLEKEAQRNAR